MRTHNIVPVPAPRMTRADAWRSPRRPCVGRYLDFKDAAKMSGLSVGAGCGLVFYLPMPKSWSKRKRAEMNGRPHTQKPDLDNLVKATFDAVFDDDSHIWDLSRVQKRWYEFGAIVVLSEEEARRCPVAFGYRHQLTLADLALEVS